MNWDNFLDLLERRSLRKQAVDIEYWKLEEHRRANDLKEREIAALEKLAEAKDAKP